MEQAVLLQNLKQKYGDWALITGASSGIGRAFAGYLAEKGMNLILAARRKERLQSLAIELQHKFKIQAVSADVDLTSDSFLEELRPYLQNREIGLLINNAGYGLAGAVEDLKMDEVRAQFETNVFGHIELTQVVIPHMRRERRGIILNVSSMSGRISYPLFSAYCASKHALEAFGEALRYELRPFDIYSVLFPISRRGKKPSLQSLSTGRNYRHVL